MLTIGKKIQHRGHLSCDLMLVGAKVPSTMARAVTSVTEAGRMLLTRGHDEQRVMSLMAKARNSIRFPIKSFTDGPSAEGRGYACSGVKEKAGNA